MVVCWQKSEKAKNGKSRWAAAYVIAAAALACSGLDRKNRTESDHDYLTMEESSAFIFYSSTSDCKSFAVGNIVLYEMSSGGIVSNRERILTGVPFLLSTARHDTSIYL